MNIYVAGKDIKVTVLIVNGLNEDFITGMTLIEAHWLYWNPESRELEASISPDSVFNWTGTKAIAKQEVK